MLFRILVYRPQQSLRLPRLCAHRLLRGPNQLPKLAAACLVLLDCDCVSLYKNLPNRLTHDSPFLAISIRWIPASKVILAPGSRNVGTLERWVRSNRSHQKGR